MINGTNGELIEQLRAEIEAAGGVAEPMVGSVAEDDVAERLIATCVQRYGGIDAVVNNAGIVRDRTLMNMTPQEFDDVIAVNLRGTWSVSRHGAKAMKETGGLLLQVISGAAFIGSLGQSNYAASKAGVMGLLYAWDMELKRFNIRVNALWPVGETDMTQVVFDNARKRAEADGTAVAKPADMGFGTPQSIAPVVVYLCSDRASNLRSQLVTFNGRKLALWQHPREAWIARSDGWTPDEIGAVLDGAAEPVYKAQMV